MTTAGADAHSAQTLKVLEPSVSDFVTLMKPRVMTLVVLTAVAGLLLAPGGDSSGDRTDRHHCHLGRGACASGALNMWYDADIDRTWRGRQRGPFPAGG